jgi:hypothetical protein
MELHCGYDHAVYCTALHYVPSCTTRHAVLNFLMYVCCTAGLESSFEATNAKLKEAQLTVTQAKAAVDTADAHTQSKQSLYNQAVLARDAARAAYDVAQQELRLVQQAAQDASAALVKISETAMAAQSKMDRTQMAAAERNRKVGEVVLLLDSARLSSQCMLIHAMQWRVGEGGGQPCTWFHCLYHNWPGCLTVGVFAQVAEAERSLQLIKSQLMLAQAKQQSTKLQIKYAQVKVAAHSVTGTAWSLCCSAVGWSATRCLAGRQFSGIATCRAC